MINRTAEILEHFSVDYHADAYIGYHGAPEIYLEPPVSIYAGRYDIEFIGGFTYLGGDRSLSHHIWMIGRFCSIAPNIQAGPFEHPTDFLSPSPIFQHARNWRQLEEYRSRNQAALAPSLHEWHQRTEQRFGKIRIGNDVWIGEGAFIRRGVTIGDGAVIAARAVVVGDVPPYAIVGGTPAKLIRYRFEPGVIEALLQLQWWRYGLSALEGVDISNIHDAIDRIDRNIASGVAQPYKTPLVRLDTSRNASLWVPDELSGKLVPTDPGYWLDN